jgi:hypothetical protein
MCIHKSDDLASLDTDRPIDTLAAVSGWISGKKPAIGDGIGRGGCATEFVELSSGIKPDST